MPDDVIAFWFGTEIGAERDEWFRKDSAFDAEVRTRFHAMIDSAIAGGLRDWESTPRGALARVLVLDQFTRNAYRDTAKAFAGDPEALATAHRMVAAGFDRALPPVARQFAYLPFEHAESADAQARSLALFEALARETGLTGPLGWARKHAAVIARFGRYPHRNVILGRPSRPEEIAFLREPGSRF